jgi:hypothetical protein
MKPPTKAGRSVIGLLALLNYCAFIPACGGGGGPAGDRAPAAIRVRISPASTTVVPGARKQFSATVLHAGNSDVIWSVEGKDGGDGVVGIISGAGVYTAPETVPTPDTVTVRATSKQDSSKTASAKVKILAVCTASDESTSESMDALLMPRLDAAVPVPAAPGKPVANPMGGDFVSGETEIYDCSRIAPGEMLTLAAGTRGPLTIRNCRGTQADPIVIRNDPEGTGPTIISRASGPEGGFVFACQDCTGVAIDGSYKWQGAPAGAAYGIKVTMTGGGGPSAFLKIGGLSRFVTIRNVEIDGAWPALASNGIGISVNDHEVNRADHPDLWREGILIEHNYVHDVKGEGMYIGGGFKYGNLLSRNIEIRHNLVEDTGWGAIDMKSAVAGDNSIHHNVVRRAGRNAESTDKASQYSGITNLSGTAEIYNNWIETTGQHGITSWTAMGPRESEGYGPFEARIWNNVIVDAGGLWLPFMSNSFGISIGAQTGCEKPNPRVYNNTIVGSRQSGIRLTGNVGAGFVRDNIVVGSGGNPAIVAPPFVELENNQVGGVAQLGFEDSTRLNFHLDVTSPAWNKGGEDFPPTDYNDEPRPRDGAPDPGAFEGSSSTASAPASD